MNRSTRDSRIVHLHIPKTAGTALRTAVQAGFPALRVFPHYDERLCAAAEADQHDVFSGHFGYQTASALGGRLVTVLRDPVDRFVSVYYFWRQLHARGIEVNRKTALAVNYSLADFATLRDEPFLAEEFFNRVTWQIAAGSSLQHRQAGRDLGVTDSKLLDQARQNLSGFAAVGFQDDMSPFNTAMARLLGSGLVVRQVNVTSGRQALADLPEETRRRIAEWCYLDIELLHHARAAFAAPTQ